MRNSVPAILSLLVIATSCAPDTTIDGGARQLPPIAGLAELRTEEPLTFQLDQGLVQNAFFREGPVAAHVVTRTADRPRFLVSFPAGNSSVGVWFEDFTSPISMSIDEDLTPIIGETESGQTLYGVSGIFNARGGALEIQQPMLSNTLILRYFMHTGEVPDGVTFKTTLFADGRGVLYARDRLDGQVSYALALEAIKGNLSEDLKTIAPDEGGEIRVRFHALSAEKPLTPFTEAELLTAAAADDPIARQVVQYLSYREKMLAGSWRFTTYFGRDTLMSLAMLMPVLTQDAAEAALRSVLVRLDKNGEVAHEEWLSELAILWGPRAGGDGTSKPVFDYKMIDDDFMLMPVLSQYLRGLTDEDASRFLDEKLPNGETVGAALNRNVEFVLTSTDAFTEEQVIGNLIALRAGEATGEWRDSKEGLAGARFSYNVNAVFVPASLQAISELMARGLLTGYAAEGVRKRLAAWSNRAPEFFEINLDPEQADERVRRYLKHLSIPDDASGIALPSGPVSYNALALYADGNPVRVMHSDESFALFFTEPEADQLHSIVEDLFAPFPAGLVTPYGPVVANPAYGTPEDYETFSQQAYHGAVVWSWQQAMLAAGLAKQLERTDLSAETRAVLLDAQARLWTAIDNVADAGGSELWGWEWSDQGFSLTSFGQGEGSVTEGNAAQLWSTVYLAIPRPEEQVQP